MSLNCSIYALWIISSLIMNKWTFNTLQLLRITYPIWKAGWSAIVWRSTYIRDELLKDWKLNNWTANWTNIEWSPVDNTWLIALIESLEIRYPKDYIPTSLEIRDTEHYAVWFQLKNDWIINNNWVLVIN